MASSIRCPHCGKAYVMKPELAGKQVRCRQCEKVFTIPAAKPPEAVLEEPILAVVVPESHVASLDTLLNLPVQDLASGEALFRPVAAQRRANRGYAVFERLVERKLATAVAIVSLLLLVVLTTLFLAIGLWWGCIVFPLMGLGLAALGLWLPVVARRSRRGPWFDPVALRISGSAGVIGLFLLILFGVVVVTAMCKHPILIVLGFSRDSAAVIGQCHVYAILICFAACFLTILVSVTWTLVRRLGLLPVANVLYLSLAALLSVSVLAAIAAPGFRRQMEFARASRQLMPPMNQELRGPSFGQSGGIPMPRDVNVTTIIQGDMPSEAGNPGHPEFYRVNLTMLQSADIAQRRCALSNLSRAQPNQLRNEISKALESLLHDPDVFVRMHSLNLLGIWSTGDIVPVAIEAINDSNASVSTTALRILGERKDPRAIEPVASLLSGPSPFIAADCLKQMGSMVEDAVLARYKSSSALGKRSIIDILGAVATEKGLARLREIAADESDLASAHQARMMLQVRRDGVWGSRMASGGRGGLQSQTPGRQSMEGPAQSYPSGGRPQERSRYGAAAAGLDPRRPDYYEKLAQQMRSEDFVERRVAVELILRGDPDKAKADTRKLIARAFGDIVQTDHGDVQSKAVRGLAKWGGKDSVPALVSLLNDRKNFFLHKAIFEVLGPMQDERAAISVAKFLGVFSDSDSACECLRQMGPAAEEGLLRVVYSPDPGVCLAAIDLMADLGTAKSLSSLQTAMKSRNPQVRQAAKIAFRRIREREKEPNAKGTDGEEANGENPFQEAD